MIINKNFVVCGSLVLLIISIYYNSIKSKKLLIESHRQEISTITEKYESQIKAYEAKLSSIQQNNIVKIVTVYKPGGERIVTKIIDKTVKTTQETQIATDSRINIADITGKTFIADSMRLSESSNSSNNIMLGVTNLQSTSMSVVDHPILAGVKIPYTPIYTFLTVPLTSDFYKHTIISAAINF
jgi:hypothetical protein